MLYISYNTVLYYNPILSELRKKRQLCQYLCPYFWINILTSYG